MAAGRGNDRDGEGESPSEGVSQSDPSSDGFWLRAYGRLFAISPLPPAHLDVLIRVSRWGVWVLALASLASLFPDQSPVAISIPFDAVVLAVAVIYGIVSGQYQDVREARACPKCGTPFGLEPVATVPSTAREASQTGGRAVECTACGHSVGAPGV